MKTPPNISDPETLILARPEVREGGAGQQLVFIEDRSLPLVKCVFLVHSGMIHQGKPLMTSSVWANLFSGTDRKSAYEIAEKLDGLGVVLAEFTEVESSGLEVNVHRDQFDAFLDLFFEVLEDACFPEKEMERYRVQRKQSFEINSQKASIVANRKFSQAFYGLEHPLGNQVEAESFEALSSERLTAHWRRVLNAAKVDVLLAGDPGSSSVNRLENWLGERKPSSKIMSIPGFSPLKGRVDEPWENAMQTAIKLGMEWPKAGHPDYMGLKFLTTLLGGYFGSRLMKEIREERGYTYGVGASLVSNRQYGVFSIQTEVGKDHREDTLLCIEEELLRLVEEPIDKVETEKVRRYMRGQILQASDGAMSQLELWKSALQLNLSAQHFVDFYEGLNEVDGSQLQALASKYLRPKELTKISIG